MLHTVASTAASREDFLRLLHAVRATIPCEKCRAHIEEYFRARPPELFIPDRSACSNYVYHMHRSVRERLGQDPGYTPEEYLKCYDAVVSQHPPQARPTAVAYINPTSTTAPRLAFRPRVSTPIYRQSADAPFRRRP